MQQKYYKEKSKKALKNSMLCLYTKCSNYSALGCELWSECPMFKSAGIISEREKISKYKSEKVEILGIRFDSKREAKRYFELRLLEQAGEISNLQRQVKYELIPKQIERVQQTDAQNPKTRVIERSCTYIADFVYVDKQGNTIVEDTKGVRTKEYRIKKKLMLYVHGIKIKEV